MTKHAYDMLTRGDTSQKDMNRHRCMCARPDNHPFIKIIIASAFKTDWSAWALIRADDEPLIMYVIRLGGL
jgi:hypothetical protein